MRRIKIFAKTLSKDEVGKALELLQAAGFRADEIAVVSEIGDPTPDCDDELALVLLSEATCADPHLEQELAKTQNGGRRAICVWPKDIAAPTEPPVAANKYGYSIITWDAARLRLVASHDDAPCFQFPSGEPLPKAHMERNLCVEEEAKRK